MRRRGCGGGVRANLQERFRCQIARETMKAMSMEWLSTSIDSIVGALIGWLIGSFFKASKADVRALAASVNERLEKYDEHGRTYVTKAELREALIDLKTESRAQFESIRSDLARIQAALLDRNRQ